MVERVVKRNALSEKSMAIQGDIYKLRRLNEALIFECKLLRRQLHAAQEREYVQNDFANERSMNASSNDTSASGAGAGTENGPFSFERVELVDKNNNPKVQYRDLVIKVSDVTIFEKKFCWLSFKLAEYRGKPQLEFRQQPTGVFDSWPPLTSDEWGDYIEFCPDAEKEKRNKSAAAINALSVNDKSKLDMVFANLEKVIRCLAIQNADDDYALWFEYAKRLNAEWSLYREKNVD